MSKREACDMGHEIRMTEHKAQGNQCQYQRCPYQTE